MRTDYCFQWSNLACACPSQQKYNVEEKQNRGYPNYARANTAKKVVSARWLSWMLVRLVIRRLQVRPLLGRQHSFMEIDHEIFSTVILSLPMVQEGQLSVSGERMCTG